MPLDTLVPSAPCIPEPVNAASSGCLIARLLAQSWRRDHEPTQLSTNQIAEITPLLLKSGAGALTWWRLQESEPGLAAPTDDFRQAYRLHSLQAERHESNLAKVFQGLRSAGIEPILVKGWAIARLYPETGLRPYGDIDLVVPPEQYEAAGAAIGSIGGRYAVDLHSGWSTLDYLKFDEVYARSILVPLNNVHIRVPAVEDHLRILVNHFLRHGGWRPMWLCDIGLAVESRPSDFDWARCLGGNKRRADWIACTIGLAHQLLGAEVEDTPISRRAKRLPRWLVPAVLKQWGQPFTDHLSQQESMSFVLRHPSGILRSLRLRWPNAIEGTIGVSAPMNEFPRLPLQIGSCLVRTARFLTGIS